MTGDLEYKIVKILHGWMDERTDGRKDRSVLMRYEHVERKVNIASSPRIFYF